MAWVRDVRGGDSRLSVIPGRYRSGYEPRCPMTPPLAYGIDPRATELIDLLERHGVAPERGFDPSGPVTGWRIDSVHWSKTRADGEKESVRRISATAIPAFQSWADTAWCAVTPDTARFLAGVLEPGSKYGFAREGIGTAHLKLDDFFPVCEMY